MNQKHGERQQPQTARPKPLYKSVLLETSSVFGGQKDYLIQISGIGPINNP